MARSFQGQRTPAELDAWVSELQPATVSHDGGSADHAGARVPRCPPASLSHAVGRRPEQAATAEARGLPPCAMTSSSGSNVGSPAPEVHAPPPLFVGAVPQINTHLIRPRGRAGLLRLNSIPRTGCLPTSPRRLACGARGSGGRARAPQTDRSVGYKPLSSRTESAGCPRDGAWWGLPSTRPSEHSLLGKSFLPCGDLNCSPLRVLTDCGCKGKR